MCSCRDGAGSSAPFPSPRASLDAELPASRVFPPPGTDPPVLAFREMRNFMLTAPAFLKAPGSVAANVAIAVSRLGGEAAFVGKLGDDEFGRMLAAILRDNGVDAGGVVFDPGARTALAFITLTTDELNVELIKRVLSAMAIGMQLLNICYCEHIPTQDTY